ncbi:ras-specific guanine nucleotide-releasing factor RalGPS2 isoform X7 [Hydra vulgaris]|uniref:Ras-specific guanine nucleotide-releasing factor RalGPS2 isoform X7 n=1 Tax=Hydra vulgaris TaxID=6087 RepID=A0ABM4BDB8_HYDVU
MILKKDFQLIFTYYSISWEKGEANCYQEMSERQGFIKSNKTASDDLQLHFIKDKDIEYLKSSGQEKAFDAVVFDVLKVQPEDIANQLTLIDLPLFQKIGPEELTSCKWTSKTKFDYCPNVVNYTKRFNHVSFWITREVLGSNTAKNRAEKIVYFIKVAKKLLDLNSLNCLKAVVSGLNSTPIYRLSKTWNLIPKRDKEKLDRLSDLLSEDNNREKFRTYLSTVKLPCIPYLGMYLTDLTYINTIHPSTGGLDYQRSNKMNEILRIIADFQQSQYDIKEKSHIVTYLNSVKYIDELQKFMEDDNYKLSLQIEPIPRSLQENFISTNSLRLSESDEHECLYPKKSIERSSSACVGDQRSSLNPKSSSLNLPFRSPSPNKKFIPGHRKAKSLGNSQQILPDSTVETPIPDLPNGSRYNLVDDSLVEHKKSDVNGSVNYESDSDDHEPNLTSQSPDPVEVEELPQSTKIYFKLEGVLKRKSCLKNGTKPKVSSWQRYWVGITCTCLFYYLPKYRGFGGRERSNFRMEPYKVVSLQGYTVFPITNELYTFELTNDSGNDVYRFQTDSSSSCNLWCIYIREAADGVQLEKPQNLIIFDDSDHGEDTPL